jgi:hypothetical protein
MTTPPIKFRKDRASRLLRGVIWTVVGGLTAPEVADVVEFADGSIVKPLWLAGFAAAASWLTSTVARRFGDPDTPTFDGPANNSTAG